VSQYSSQSVVQSYTDAACSAQNVTTSIGPESPWGSDTHQISASIYDACYWDKIVVHAASSAKLPIRK